MEFSFDKSKTLIYVTAVIHGPDDIIRGSMALDTGATRTCISPHVLTNVGYDVGASEESVVVTTGNGTVSVPTVSILGLRCLGHTKNHLIVNALGFPSKQGIVRLLGLDFLQNCKLCIDYRDGTVELL